MNNKLNNPIVYFFAKSNDIYFSKFEKAKYFLEKYQINNNVYYDIYKRNNLKFKNKLNKILLSYSNVDLCILSIRDLGRSMTDLLNIMKLCNERNIRIYDFEKDKFFDIKMFLVFADEQRRLNPNIMEQTL